ncbi:MAG: hypothetical protein MHM6MM_006058 [Cercozoa sp. M6MM]
MPTHERRQIIAFTTQLWRRFKSHRSVQKTQTIQLPSAARARKSSVDANSDTDSNDDTLYDTNVVTWLVRCGDRSQLVVLRHTVYSPQDAQKHNAALLDAEDTKESETAEVVSEHWPFLFGSKISNRLQKLRRRLSRVKTRSSKSRSRLESMDSKRRSSSQRHVGIDKS